MRDLTPRASAGPNDCKCCLTISSAPNAAPAALAQIATNNTGTIRGPSLRGLCCNSHPQTQSRGVYRMHCQFRNSLRLSLSNTDVAQLPGRDAFLGNVVTRHSRLD